MTRRNWQRQELLLALNLYCKLPFGKYHSHNSDIIKLAGLIDRTPDAVAMKLSNFASFDPVHQSRGIKGLQNAGQSDREIWNEFHSNWDTLAVESELIYARLSGEAESIGPLVSPTDLVELVPLEGPTEAEREVKVRLGQRFFRKVILASFAYQCCMCGMPIPGLLVASHIIAWRDNENLRVNPYNGLCLCALHDKGFDRGLFTLGVAYEIIIGRAAREHLSHSAVQQAFGVYEGQVIHLPDKFIPDQAFLAYHRNHYFVR
jgi:putative restriction endonuclease